MGDKTKIQWCDATWNPLRGCSKVSAGCKNCYAEKVARRFSGPGKPYEGLVDERGKWNGTIREVPEHLDDPIRWVRSRMIFVNSMSDLFHRNVDFAFIAAVFGVMGHARHHTFQVLTKRDPREWFRWVEAQAKDAGIPPQHLVMSAACVQLGCVLAPGSSWPLANVCVGVSASDQPTADRRLPWLRETPAAVRFLSAEPLVGPMWIRDHLDWLDWVIVGGESGQRARPCFLDWIASIVKQCAEAGVPCFVKQVGRQPMVKLSTDAIGKMTAVDGGWLLRLDSKKGDDPEEWGRYLRHDINVQEMPEVGRG
jgi:protein gp37